MTLKLGVSVIKTQDYTRVNLVTLIVLKQGVECCNQPMPPPIKVPPTTPGLQLPNTLDNATIY